MSTRARSPVARHSSPKDVLSFLLLSLFIFLVGPSGASNFRSEGRGGYRGERRGGCRTDGLPSSLTSLPSKTQIQRRRRRLTRSFLLPFPRFYNGMMMMMTDKERLFSGRGGGPRVPASIRTPDNITDVLQHPFRRGLKVAASASSSSTSTAPEAPAGTE